MYIFLLYVLLYVCETHIIYTDFFSRVSGESLRFCSSASTCCTPQLEDQLSKEIKAAFSESLRKDFGKAKTKMATRTSKFDEFFQVSGHTGARRIVAALKTDLFHSTQNLYENSMLWRVSNKKKPAHIDTC